MLLNLGDALKHQGDSYAFSLHGSLAPDALPEGMKLTGPVALAGSMTALKDEVALLGTLTVKVAASCARCLSPLTYDLSLDYSEILVRTGMKEEPEPDEAPEDQPEAVPFEGTTCDLTDSVREAILLALPMRLTCKEDCKGLCPTCGANLNETTCGHNQAGESPFSILSKLRFDQEEEV